MTTGQVGGGVTPGEVVRRRLRALRRRRKLNAAQAAERFDDPAMSATVLMNIEAGRRQTGATVDELMRFAYVLDVPPAALLVEPGGQIEVAAGVVVDAARFQRWIRGQEPLDGTDERLYHEAAAEALEPADRAVPPELRTEFLQRAQAAFDGFFADSEELHRKTREQVRAVLDDVRSAVTDGATAEELLDLVDGYLNRLTK